MTIIVDEATEFTKKDMEYLTKRMNAGKNMGHVPTTTMKREHPSLATTIGADYLSALSTEVGEWANANFDSKDPLDPFMGLIEELGELAKFEKVNPLIAIVAKMCHHVLKARQGIRGAEEEHANAFNAMLLTLRGFPDNAWEERNTLFFSKHSGDVLHKKTNLPMTEAEILAERKDAVGDIMIYLSDYCYRNGFDLGTITQETWAKVSQRDWRKNPVDAAEKAGD